MQRAYDQIIHDVALQNLPVVLCLDRGGLVGQDGPTHHGVFDIAYLRHIPNMILAAPMNELELRNLMYTAQLHPNGPFAIRYPRGRGVIADWRKPFEEIPVGKARLLREGNDIAILSAGHPGNFAVEAIEKLGDTVSVEHIDIRFIKPLDEECLHAVFKKFKRIITLEDGTVAGGFGSAVLEFMSNHGYQANVKIMGVPDRFIEQGTLQELYRDCGFDAESIYHAVISMVPRKTKAGVKKVILKQPIR